MKRRDPLELQVEEFLSKLDPSLLSPQPLLVAVSGGPDSIALLHLLDGLASRFSLSLYIAHLHHGQRPEGDGDAALVAEEARSLGRPCTVERTDVPALAGSERLSIEPAGRGARYRFLARLATETGAAAVATGHHADDQAETVLMRAFRGAGIAGLRGIPDVGPLPESGGTVTVIRPLIGAGRNEILRYLRDHGLGSRLDSTNLDMRIARNRLRAELLPLAEAISPGAARGLLRIAGAASEDERLLGALALRGPGHDAPRVGGRSVVLVRENLPPAAALRRRVLRRALHYLLGGAEDYPERAMDRLLEWLDRSEDVEDPAGLIGSLPRGIRARASRSEIRIELAATPLETAAIRVELNLPGRTGLPLLGLELLAQFAPPGAFPPFPARDSMEAAVDADAICGALFVRTWEPGDRIRVLGSGGTRKLQDLFTDARVPAPERPLDRWSATPKESFGAAGLALRDGAKITERTVRAIRFALRAPDDPGGCNRPFRA